MWEFYASRRRQALGADPNAAHWALAELARRRQFSGSGVRRSERGCEGTKKGGKSEGEGQGGKREEEEEEEEDDDDDEDDEVMNDNDNDEDSCDSVGSGKGLLLYRKTTATAATITPAPCHVLYQAGAGAEGTYSA